MSPPPDPADRERPLAFFGGATAGLSHEINNVLAILNELAGLLGDLLAGAERSGPLDPARLRGVVQRCGAQLERGKDQVRLLHRLAHSVDGPGGPLDARDPLDLAVALGQRLARLRKVRLDAVRPAGPLLLHGRPFDVLHAVHRGLAVALGRARPGSAVEVRAAAEGGGVRVDWTVGECDPAAGADGTAAGEAAAAAARLGGRLDSAFEPGQPGSVRLWLPGVLPGPVAAAAAPAGGT